MPYSFSLRYSVVFPMPSSRAARSLSPFSLRKVSRMASFSSCAKGRTGVRADAGAAANICGHSHWPAILQVKVLQLRGQVAQVQYGTRGKSAGAIQRMLQLAHVSRPLIFDQSTQSIIAEGVGGAGFSRQTLQKMRGQQRNILLAFAQRGNTQVDDTEAVVEIFAEAALLHHRRQIAVGRRQDTYIDGSAMSWRLPDEPLSPAGHAAVWPADQAAVRQSHRGRRYPPGRKQAGPPWNDWPR